MKTAIVDISKNLMGVDVSLVEGDTASYMHPVNSFKIRSRTAEYGDIGILHPAVNKSIDKRFNVAMLEIDFEKLANTVAYAKKIRQVSKYQAVDVDFNILCDKDMKYIELTQILSKFKSRIVNGYDLIDIYENEQVLGNKKSVTLRFNLSSLDHTLSGEEIEKFRSDLLEFLSRNKLELRA